MPSRYSSAQWDSSASLGLWHQSRRDDERLRENRWRTGWKDDETEHLSAIRIWWLNAKGCCGGYEVACSRIDTKPLFPTHHIATSGISSNDHLENAGWERGFGEVHIWLHIHRYLSARFLGKFYLKMTFSLRCGVLQYIPKINAVITPFDGGNACQKLDQGR